MLRITIDFTDANTAKTVRLGSMQITNDGTGTRELGNYTATLIYDALTPTGEKVRYAWGGKVMKWPRLEKDAWGLTHRALSHMLRYIERHKTP